MKPLSDFSDFDEVRINPIFNLVRLVRTLLVGLLVGLFVVFLSLAALWAVVFIVVGWDSGQRTRSFGAAETKSAVSQILFSWKLREEEVYHETTQNGHVITQNTRAIPGLQGIRGFTESSGWNGDGTDYYEAELSPELTNELKTKLARSTMKQVAYFPGGEKYAPDWWPKQLPPGAVCYEHNYVYLILSPNSRKVWIFIFRS